MLLHIVTHMHARTRRRRSRCFKVDPETSEDWAEEKAEVLSEFDKFVLAPALKQLKA